MAESWDAIVVGAGPNGLAAAIEIARSGYRVKVLEAMGEPGGGTHTRELTLPGFHHDQCSGVHPMGILSPYFRKLPLADFGLEWLASDASVAHPLDDGYAVMLHQSLDRTADQLIRADARRWRNLFRPFLNHPHELLEDLMGPLGRMPNRPLSMARFGWHAVRPARNFANGLFENHRARALFAGCAGHSVLSLDHWMTTALGMIFCLTAHVENWPVARGGSRAIGQALSGYLKSLGGEIECDRHITSLEQLPETRAVLFDLSPKAVTEIAGEQLPNRYRKRLGRYRYGPGTFKIDWALDGEIPWRDARVAAATTVHVGGKLEEIADSERDAWQGRHNDRPYLILCQQSHADPSRAPAGKHTGYAYCHVPHGSNLDMTERIEAQIERFAPGFRDLILARHTTSPADFEAFNPNYVGGAITGGAADWSQLFTRPVARSNPYTTPNRKLYLCSASTPPGGGVHGMCGYYAARAVIRRLERGKI
ncbi:MAG: NAD(P)/FAD-dependent oxidoreductase [Deltaproteobacteria bacterium]|nr:NAD(P)/FAD-dependent oxidoreductase [Deltaproteobacteria bacterium]